MKLLFFSFILLSLCFIANDYTNRNEKKVLHALSPMSRLDSLQGNWINQNDTTFQMIITGRILDEIDIDTSAHYTNHSYYRLYFSDTMVNKDLNVLFNSVKIDTLSVKGKYLIKVSAYDNSVWCYEINGFNKNGSALTFSMSDIWADRVPGVFKKKN
jgi:hypothetical protein